MFDYLKENPTIKLLLNLIVGIILFKILFGLVFGGSAAGTFQGLIVLVLQLVKVVIVLALVAGSMLFTNKLLSGQDFSKIEFTPEKISKGLVIGVLGIIAFYLLTGTLGGSGGGYYSFNLAGLFTGLLNLLLNLFTMAIVVFLALGVLQATRPYWENELKNFFTPSQPAAPQSGVSANAGHVEVAPQQKLSAEQTEAVG